MNTQKKFDILIYSNEKLPEPIVNNLAELIFKKLPHRKEKCYVIYSHYNEKFVKISLKNLRYIISKLFVEFQEKNIRTGDTVLLVTLSSNNPLLIALMFAALTSLGIRVVLPFFIETSDLEEWIKYTKCKTIIFPEKEVLGLTGHDNEKKVINKIRYISEKNKVILFDIEKDFSINTYLNKIVESNSYETNPLVKKAINDTKVTTEAVIFTTSGSSGKSKLILYEQGAFIRNCNCWQTSGLYDKNLLGGRSFIDIFTHTISIRAFFNALWTGYPICIVNSNWVKEKPEKILSLFIKMQPENMTLGPSSFNYLLEYIKLVPEIKSLAFSNLKTVVSTGASYNQEIACKMKQIMNLYLHNAYGTSETQQVLTTLLCKSEQLDDEYISLGKPIAGVKIGLIKFNEDSYRLYIKTPFGHKKEIGKKSINPGKYYYWGDIVKIGKDNSIIYVGRENRDFFKTGFGLKIPISYIKKYYKELYDNVRHIEYYPFENINFSFGLCALIFVNETNLALGRVTDKKIIKKYYDVISDINLHLKNIIEPFEYEQVTISRFLLINGGISKTIKGTISKDKLESDYKNEIYDLKHSNDISCGVKNLRGSENLYLKFLLKYSPLRFSIFRKAIFKLLKSRIEKSQEYFIGH